MSKKAARTRDVGAVRSDEARQVPKSERTIALVEMRVIKKEGGKEKR